MQHILVVSDLEVKVREIQDRIDRLQDEINEAKSQQRQYREAIRALRGGDDLFTETDGLLLSVAAGEQMKPVDAIERLLSQDPAKIWEPKKIAKQLELLRINGALTGGGQELIFSCHNALSKLESGNKIEVADQKGRVKYYRWKS